MLAQRPATRHAHVGTPHLGDYRSLGERRIAHSEIRPVIGAVDETSLQRMMRVFMDLATGYLLMEEVIMDRSFDTWYDRANDRLTTWAPRCCGLRVTEPRR